MLTGAGRGFCAGQDLKEFGEAGDVSDALRRVVPPERARDPRAREAGDRRGERRRAQARASRSPARATFASPPTTRASCPGFIGIGLVPDAGGTYFLHRLLGASRAFEWMSSNRRLTAAEAHAWGLVSEVVEADALQARAAELAATYAALPTRGIGMTKRLFDHADNATLEEQLEMEAQLQAAATQTEDFREGVAAFLEKRAPRFTGQ